MLVSSLVLVLVSLVFSLVAGACYRAPVAPSHWRIPASALRGMAHDDVVPLSALYRVDAPDAYPDGDVTVCSDARTAVSLDRTSYHLAMAATVALTEVY